MLLSPLPRRDGIRIRPQATLGRSRFLLQPLQLCVAGVPSKPPSETLSPKLVVDFRAVSLVDIGDGAPVFVCTARDDSQSFLANNFGEEFFGFPSKRLIAFWRIDAIQAQGQPLFDGERVTIGEMDGHSRQCLGVDNCSTQEQIQS